MFLLDFYRSTIGKKVIMAVTGLLLVGFVVGHMLGHLQVFQSAEKYNAYAHFLQSLGGGLWIARGGLLVASLLHILCAVELTRAKRAARPVGYEKLSPQVSTFASRTIRWGGVLLAVFIVFHVLHFTTMDIYPEYRNVDVYSRLIIAFRKPWILAFYIVSMLALGLHLYHGLWSSVRTLGFARPSANPLRRQAALAVAVLVALGFAVVPIAIALGVVKASPAVDHTVPVAAAPAVER